MSEKEFVKVKRTAEQIIVVIKRHSSTAKMNSVTVSVDAWDTLARMVEELEQNHKEELYQLNVKLEKTQVALAAAPPPPPPPPKKKIFRNGKLVSP